MSITILPALPTEAATITPIGVLAFANDVFNARLAKPNGTPAQHEEYLQWRIRRNERRMAKPGGTWFKAVDAETGEVVGCTGVQAPGPEEGEGEANGEVQEAEPEIFNGEFMREWHEAMEKVRKECMGERQDYWYVVSMVVHPDRQGKGIGKRLLEKDCELADAAGQDIYLEASPAGKKLYLNAGFEVIGEKSMLDGAAAVTAMLRKARPVVA
ncbi:hypothetical protein WHR41_02294 [Cladosporium halotolerans]|uniref:N-acetyltransferase domain-containing protein n=1 Tax=Cladosporium halotolerans TaxID=1052096 RepID=A0AB34L0V4_9PEZI